jgi:putative copper resistance protein D
VVDLVAIGLRGLAFAAALQAAGAANFCWLFGGMLERSVERVRSIAVHTVVVALILVLADTLVAPARLVGDFGGIFDGSLQALLLGSDAGTSAAVRTLGLLLLLGGSIKRSRLAAAMALTGATLVVVSFAFVGHTAADDRRWLLAPLLIVHLTVIAFWFGGLWPLLASIRRESAAVGGAAVAEFSRVASWLVPIILVAGLALAVVLLPALASLGTPYGLMLIAKLAGFAVLMGLAAANKWRFGPRIATGDAAALTWLLRSVIAEWLLILTVVIVTATMTALFSPE